MPARRSQKRGSHNESSKKSTAMNSSNALNVDPMSMPWYASKDEVIMAFQSNEVSGLTTKTIEDYQNKYGFNELDEEPGKSLFSLVLEQFEDLLVQILLGAAVISFLIAFFEENENESTFHAFVEPAVILLILIINAIVGVWQESNAEAALDALKALQPTNAKVYRNNEIIHKLPARELVPGDIVEINVGDKVPADMRIIKLMTTTIRMNESALTGESATVVKEIHPLSIQTGAISSKKNMVFSGTTVSGGRALCIVIMTGMRTEIGKIQQAVQDEEDDKTPLKIKLDEFGETLTKVIGIICILVWIMNYKQFFDPIHGSLFKGCIYYFKIAVALGVAAIPEGLPAVITLCLALGTRKMVKKNAIIRKLPSVETLGCCTVICSDKTGTLTMNEMTAVKMSFFESKHELSTMDIKGSSYNPEGSVIGLDSNIDIKKDAGLVYFSKCCSLNNESNITRSNDNKKYIAFGQPTEAALKVLVEKIGFPSDTTTMEKNAIPLNSSVLPVNSNYFHSRYNINATMEFSRGRKSMSVLVSDKHSNHIDNDLYCKGAPEAIVSRCNKVMLRNGTVINLTKDIRDEIMEQTTILAATPLRTLALAMKKDLGILNDYDGTEEHRGHQLLSGADPDEVGIKIEKDMIFLGLVGIKDPARPEVSSSIEQCKVAGIRVIMITGDNKETAEAIAREIGIFSKDEDISKKSYTGAEFMSYDKKTQHALLQCDHSGRVFSRADPIHKQTLVNLLKEEGEVPAMTGDGVNDAPALKAASIGIAMGISGTEVAKEASDMVLADDNFATIVAAVEEGRSIYNNMKAFIRYLISSNIGEVASIFFTAALGVPEGLIPVQLLWVNLVTDGPPATALGFNPPDPDVMRKPPRRATDQLITQWVFFRYMVVGLYVGFATVGVFVYWYLFYDWSEDSHSLITFEQLSHFGECPSWSGFKVNDFDGLSFVDNPCSYFTIGKTKASTLSLSVLVTIEMLNALNALSEDSSLLTIPPHANPWLLVAMAVSFGLHFVILYVPMFCDIFSLSPLSWNDWMLTLAFSFPVIIIDEILKFVGRMKLERELKAIRQKEKSN